MATIYIDDVPYEVDANDNLLHACLSLGLDLPYFCWHPALGSVGACRQCAVKQFKDEEDTQGRIVMACMTPAADGTRISVEDGEAAAFRESIIELLMVNHPHDCPICDEGGECHLQDMTVMTGHDYRRYRFNKRTYRNQYLGPFINHEMNRCIQCYRCVRFYREHAGGRDLDVFGAHDHVYFGRSEDGVLENEFSGNLVEVCPTGVFTDKTLKQHYTRKWDLQTAPSVCAQCGVGCNTIPGERYGKLRRIRNRYHHDVNGYFLCDRGRYGYEFVNSQARIRQPQRRREGEKEVQVAASDEVLAHVADLLADGKRAIGIGSPRASLEANYALRTLVGPEHFYAGVSAQDFQLVGVVRRILQEGPARSASLRDARQADAVFVLGEDATNTAPMLALALRQSVRNQPLQIALELGIEPWNDGAVREAIQHKKGPFFVATPTSTKLDDIAAQTYRAAPDDLARLGFAVAHFLDTEAPAVPGLPEEEQSLAEEIARALQEAERPLLVSGTSCGSQALMQAAANVAWALSGGERAASLSLTVPEGNSLGLALMDGADLQSAHQALSNGEADTVVIVENDLYRQATPSFVNELLDAAEHVVVIDHLENETTARADVVLPAATFAEGDGTLVNSEGRAQRFYQVFVPEGDVQESWRWLRDMVAAIGREEEVAGWHDLDDVVAELAESIPVFASVPEIAPPAEFRLVEQKVPREPHRYSGRTATLANITVHEPKPPDDPDSALAFSMEGFKGMPPPALQPRYWAPRWNSVQALNKFQDEVGGPLRGGDPGRRLIEPTAGESASYFGQVPEAFQASAGQWLAVPLYHIFGSEELSMYTPGVAERAPQPYLALNPADADSLGLNEGEAVKLSLAELTLDLPLRLEPSLPQGLAGMPVGLPHMPPVTLPVWSRLRPGAGGEEEAVT